MEKSDRDHAVQLLEMAIKDHSALLKMQDRADFGEEVFGFHAQQAIEKSLKSWMTILHLSYPKSHNISVLLQTLKRAGADVGEFPNLDSYTIFAVQYRYEAFDAAEDELDRPSVVRMMAALIDHVRQVIGDAK